MSVHPLAWVLKNSEAKLGNRLVLIVLADHASDDGTGAYPSVATIAHECRMSPRNVQYALRDLAKEGSIIEAGVSRYGTTVYTVRMGANTAPPSTLGGGADLAPPAESAPAQDLRGGAQEPTAILSDFAPEPSFNPKRLQQPPQPPASGGSSPRPVAPKGRRKSDQAKYSAELAAWVEANHPHPAAVADDLLSAWKPISDQLAATMDQATFDLWIATLHPHSITTGEVVLAAPPATVGWVEGRLTRLIAQHTGGRQVVVVPCTHNFP